MDQHYYSNQFGRFMSPDPYQATATSPSDAKDPQSWNRYAYVGNDPTNRRDPHGLSYCDMLKDQTQDAECNGGGGDDDWSCTLDGINMPCSMVYRVQQMGAAVTPQQYLLDKLFNASHIAQEALSELAHCAGLFNLPGGMDPYVFFTSDPRLHISYDPAGEPRTNASTRGTPGGGTATINFNTDPGSGWVNGSPRDNAHTVIHELLHAAVDVFGPSAVSAFWIQHDDSVDDQSKNWTLILVNCGF